MKIINSFLLIFALGLGPMVQAEQTPRFVEDMIFTRTSSGNLFSNVVKSYDQLENDLVFDVEGRAYGLTGSDSEIVSSQIVIHFKTRKAASLLAKNFQGPKEMTLEIKLNGSEDRQPGFITVEQSAVVFGDPDGYYCRDTTQETCALEQLKGF